MLVVDTERSETRPQRKRAPNGRPLHCCCICGKLDTWGDGWTTYCSEKEIDDCIPIPKFCSEPCRAKGGLRAKNVTEAMKQTAREAEMRPPIIRWREATEREKYNAAAQAQARRPNHQPTE